MDSEFTTYVDGLSETMKALQAKDATLGELKNSSGWQNLKARIENTIKDLNSRIPINSTDTPELIGFKYLVTRTAADYLQSIIDVVEVDA